jgi:hypothetical protein
VLLYKWQDHENWLNQEDAMKTALATIIALIATSTAFAASGAQTEDSGLLVALFLGVGALIVAFQLLPGLTLFGSMMKGLLPGKGIKSRH